MSHDPQHPPYPPQQPDSPAYVTAAYATAWGQGYSGYSYPPRLGGRRPGLLTAIGVVSIIVASLSFLGSGISVLSGMMMLRVARVTTTMATSSSSQYNAPTRGAAAATGAAPGSAGPWQGAQPGTPVSGPVVGPRGMDEAERAVVASALESLESISPARRRQLDAMLARSGQDFFPSDDPDAGRRAPLTAAAVDAAVKNHDTVPSADPGEPEPIYFETAGGRLELHDDRAIFRPSNPGVPAVRTSAPPDAPVPGDVPDAPARLAPPPPGPMPTTATAASDDPFAPPPQSDPFANPDPTTLPASGNAPSAPPAMVAPVPAGSGSALTPAQVQGVIQKVQAACGNKLNPAQVSALRTALANPSQQLVTQSTLWAPVAVAQMQPDGSALLKLNGAVLIIDPQGQVTNQFSTMMPKISLNPMPIGLVEGEAAASLALAAFLMVSGIFVLKQSPRGRRLHQIYALVKIPLAVVAIAGFFWMMSDLTNNINRTSSASGGGGGPSEGFTTFGITMTALGLVYPIALLLALHTKTVREYYRAMAAEA